MAFDGERLRLIRNYRDLTQRGLAEMIAVSPGSISFYERGREPTSEVVRAMSDVLGVTPEYFGGPPVRTLTEDETNFRSRAVTSPKLRQRVLAHGTLLAIWIRYLRERIRLPAFQLPRVEVSSAEDVERAAEHCREEWGLGTGPIQRVSRTLENCGVAVAVMGDTSKHVDAFSYYSNDLSLVVLSSAKGSGSRRVFDAVHELGHGVLHRGDSTKPRDQKEPEADRFAGAFLLPRKHFPREFWSGGGSSLGHLLELKKRWGVSISAMVYRAHQLDLINTAQYRRWMQKISQQGWRSGEREPGEPELLAPELLPRAFEKLEASGGSARAVAADLGWGVDLFSQVTGLSVQPENGPTSLDEFRAKKSAS